MCICIHTVPNCRWLCQKHGKKKRNGEGKERRDVIEPCVLPLTCNSNFAGISHKYGERRRKNFMANEIDYK